ncbi:MAG: hypothetical protein GPOALKHO_000936 [Sodalis sp.]|nr:MAG: hypothetical protein GPOALKHO_000936 [Sodalis sp.]
MVAGMAVLLRRLTLHRLTLRLAVNCLLRQPRVELAGGFSLSFMLPGLLLMMRGDLLKRWQQKLPPESPNYFLLNMTDLAGRYCQSLPAAARCGASVLYLTVRAWLISINNRIATDIIKPNDPGGHTVNRELNLTWLRDLPDHNHRLTFV